MDLIQTIEALQIIISKATHTQYSYENITLALQQSTSLINELKLKQRKKDEKKLQRDI